MKEKIQKQIEELKQQRQVLENEYLKYSGLRAELLQQMTQIDKAVQELEKAIAEEKKISSNLSPEEQPPPLV